MIGVYTGADGHYSGLEDDANAFLTAVVKFCQLQTNELSRQGSDAVFGWLAADFADGTFLGVNTSGGPIDLPIAGGAPC